MSKVKAFLKAWDTEMAFMAPPHDPSGGILHSLVWFGAFGLVLLLLALA